MMISFSAACKQAHSPVNFPGGVLTIDPFISWRRKEKVIIVMGATGTGKSRLSIDLATRFPSEIINSDKIQVYKGLDIVTNKVTKEECKGIPHHLLGIINPNEDFTSSDFQNHALNSIESIINRNRVPIIAGGSNSYVKALVHDNISFRSNYECCFLWVDVARPVLHSFVSKRVDGMVQSGLVDEVRRVFGFEGDYTKGIFRAIGVPEMDQFLRNEKHVDQESKKKMLEVAIENIKLNTCELACCQLEKIRRLRDQLGWNIHRIDATEVFMKPGEEVNESWDKLVVGPSCMIVDRFLKEDHHDFVMSGLATPPSSSVITAGSILGAAPATAVAAVSH